MLTKNAVKNLINKYKAVLVNCRLLNVLGAKPLVLGALALVTGMPSVAVSADIVGMGVNQTDPWISSNAIDISSTSGTVMGIKATGSPNNITLRSAHAITVVNEGDGTKAYGMYGIGPSNTLTSAGTISVTVKGNNTDVYGMQGTSGSAKNTFTNTGTIAVTADGNNVHAYGMKGEGAKNSFTNAGTITVTAEVHGSAHGNAHGMFGNCATNTLNNSGTMTITAAGDRIAYGMGVWRGTGTLNNTGTINVSGTKAYQAYVKNSTAHVGTWTLKLGESYGSGYHVFGAGNGGTLIFGEGGLGGKGATLIISGLGDAFVNDTEYAISDMIDIVSATSTAPSGTVTGYIENVTSSYAFLKVELVDKGTADNSYTDQYIRGVLNVTEDNSPTQSVTAQTVSGMRNNLNQLRNIVEGQTRATGERLDFGKRNIGSEVQSITATLYADAGGIVSDAGGIVPDASFAPDASFVSDASFVPDATYLRPTAPAWETFLTPYYSQYGANNGAYDGHVHGIAMGATRTVTKDFSLGAHFALSKGTGDSTLTDSVATTYTLGAHAVYSVGESLFFRGQLSGFMAENDLNMVGSSAKLTRANTDMDTVGVYAMLAAGYDIMLAPEHFLTPELGLSYFYAHMDGFDADFYDVATGAKDTALGMDNEAYDVWFADATVRWTGVFAMDKGTLRPTVKAGVRQALTNPDVSSTMRFGTSATTATTHSDANDTAFLCEAGLAWEYNGITLSATYSGEFGNIEYSHMGMFKAEWKF